MTLRQIEDQAALDAALTTPTFLLFKHSPICPISSQGYAAYEAWHAEHPDVPTGWVDVIAGRALARDAAATLGIAHASPQALLVRDGACVWNASHMRISAASLAEAVAAHATPA